MEYSARLPSPVLPKGRRRLQTVLRSAGLTVSISDASSALDIGRARAALLLSRWVRQGLLKRVKQGLYVPVPLDTTPSEAMLEDPWVLIPRIFGESYVGGWSAAEHWDLTEQIFSDICVFTTRSQRSRVWTLPGVTFTAKHITARFLFGLKQVWRGNMRVPVSDSHKTIVDMLDDPSVGGGIAHVAHCLSAYLRSKEASPETLIEYAGKLGNGAVFKRLGFLAERSKASEFLIAECRKNMTKGYAKLDPNLLSRRVVRRWNLWVPERVEDVIRD